MFGHFTILCMKGLNVTWTIMSGLVNICDTQKLNSKNQFFEKQKYSWRFRKKCKKQKAKHKQTTFLIKTSEATTGSILQKKVFSKFFRKSHRKTSALEFPFGKDKVAGLKAFNFIKKKLQRRCFPVRFVKFLRTPILKNICERLLLKP